MEEQGERFNRSVQNFLIEVCIMCDCGCTSPEKKVKDPKKCSPEQIAECHPESKGHPCEE